MRSIYKCACGNVSLTENGNRCPVCGDLLVRFDFPSIEPRPSRVDARRVLYGLGVGALIAGIAVVIFLGCLM
ncbi:hypothetical protein ER57_08060 [Smithella sp. SCADC]|jgi:hypothetical protein|nr:hypothetical protein ER57_08060 [Smithella sp. SCADC]